MCGIAGTLAPTPAGNPRRDAVLRMCACLAHRGPDHEGVVTAGPVTLGHRRLAIIDLSAEAAQPMANEDGTLQLAVNGEIYNFQELRRDLVARGHRFRSHSDSEVILHLYEEEGADCVARLRGMFALALWDARRQQLLLARDRFGKKPLYYHYDPRQGLAFASELQALSASNGFAREVDPAALDAYLSLQYIPSPQTIFRNVYKLAPGTRAVVRPGQVPRPEPYARLRFDAQDGRPLPDLVAELRARLDEAVRLRMVADVPVGAFLSGGIDSSTIVALMAARSSRPIRTFSIGFPSADTSELEFARLIAQRFGTEHHELIVEPRMVSVVPDLVRHYGEPFADSSAVPTWYLARLTRESVTVALSGDGGDEAFAGYNQYRFAHIARGVRALPGPLPGWIAGGLSRLQAPRLQPVRDFGRRLMLGEVERYLGLVAHFPYEERAALYGPAMREAFPADRIAARFERLLAAATARDAVDRLSELDFQTYLPDDILVKVDIASMAHALEVRSPFLDQRVVEFAASIPSRYKLRGLSTKIVLRRAVADLVPRRVVSRLKRGFALPIDRWMREDLAPMAHDLLRDRTARERGWFDPGAVDRLLAAHERGESRGNQLWALLMLEQWFRTFVDTAPEPAVPALTEAR